MLHKSASSKSTDTKKSVIIVPSSIAPPAGHEDVEGIEETEIAAEISVPAEGGWGWVVVAGSFFSIFILDGIFLTFGSIYPDIVQDMQLEGTLVALINSVAVALYFLIGPVASALINRFGFRACTMLGSIILSLSFFSSYFATSYMALLFFYGVISGFGACLVAMASSIVVGFYFERLRALALSIATVGSSLGVMIMFSINSYLVNLAGWRITTLIHSGLFGIIYFLAMTFRPLLSITITKTTDDPTRTVTYLPSVTAVKARGGTPGKKEAIKATLSERWFSAVSNARFPTAASVVEEGVLSQQTTTQAGPSTTPVSKLTITARSGLSRRQLNQVKSMMSRASQSPEANIEVQVQMPLPKGPPQKQKWWARCCDPWEEHVPESRPMYRDDAFYGGRVEDLPIYQKSVMETAPEARTGLEYQMAVSRAVTAADLEERRGVFTTAVRRTLATMMDPKLLKRCSFLSLCSTGFLTYIGLLIPYVFLPDKNKLAGIDPHHCTLFVSVIGLSSAIGRLLCGVVAIKLNPLKLYIFSCILTGLAIMAYNFSFNVYYQYMCCIIFGIFVACVSSLRSLVIVDLYGLDKLTNATGMLVMFQGFGSLISTPLSSILKNMFGYAVSFYVAGFVMLLGGISLLPVQKLIIKENQIIELEKDKNVTTSSKRNESTKHNKNVSPKQKYASQPRKIIDSTQNLHTTLNK